MNKKKNLQVLFSLIFNYICAHNIFWMHLCQLVLYSFAEH